MNLKKASQYKMLFDTSGNVNNYRYAIFLGNLNFPEIIPCDFTYQTNIFYHQNISQKNRLTFSLFENRIHTKIIQRLLRNINWFEAFFNKFSKICD